MKKCEWETKVIHRGESYYSAGCKGIVTDSVVPKYCPYCGKGIALASDKVSCPEGQREVKDEAFNKGNK